MCVLHLSHECVSVLCLILLKESVIRNSAMHVSPAQRAESVQETRPKNLKTFISTATVYVLTEFQRGYTQSTITPATAHEECVQVFYNLKKKRTQ